MSEPSNEVAIAVEAVSKTYDSGSVRALDEVSTQLRRGEFVAVVGQSGSGKSTFLNMIGTLDQPTAGRVLIDGRDAAAIRPLAPLRRDKIGFVFQSHNLVPNLSLLDNVAVPLVGAGWRRERRRQRAAELLARVGLSGRVGHRATRCSGGERQRAAVARALALDPPILLADEPTGNLDSGNGRQVLELLVESGRESSRLLVVVTHNPEIAAAADRRLLFRDGRLAEES